MVARRVRDGGGAGSARTPAVVAVELNVSCPNVESGCISIGTDPGETRALVERCRDETDVPVLAKLSPSVTEIEAIATAAAEGGAHGLVLINTVRGIAIDRATLRPLLGGGGGGLSGPAVKPVALHAVYHARRCDRPSNHRDGGRRRGARCQ